MQALMHRWLARMALAAMLASLPIAPALAQNSAVTDAKAPPTGFVAPAEPKADESNAQRSKTQAHQLATQSVA